MFHYLNLLAFGLCASTFPSLHPVFPPPDPSPSLSTERGADRPSLLPTIAGIISCRSRLGLSVISFDRLRSKLQLRRTQDGERFRTKLIDNS